MRNPFHCLCFTCLVLLVSFAVASGLINNVMAATAGKKSVATTTQSKIQKTEKQFNDWQLVCKNSKQPREKCYITHKKLMRDTEQLLLAVRVSPVESTTSPEPRLIFTLPLGIFLPAGMSFTVDSGDRQKLPIRYCTSRGCRAVTRLDDGLITQLKKGHQLKVSFMNSLNKKPMTVKASLKGFSQSFAALKAKGKSASTKKRP